MLQARGSKVEEEEDVAVPPPPPTASSNGRSGDGNGMPGMETLVRVHRKFDDLERALEEWDDPGMGGMGSGSSMGSSGGMSGGGWRGRAEGHVVPLPPVKLDPISPNTHNKVLQIVEENNRDAKAMRRQLRRAKKKAKEAAHKIKAQKRLEDHLPQGIGLDSSSQDPVVHDAEECLFEVREHAARVESLFEVMDGQDVAEEGEMVEGKGKKKGNKEKKKEKGKKEKKKEKKEKRHRHPPKAELARKAPRPRPRGLAFVR